MRVDMGAFAIATKTIGDRLFLVGREPDGLVRSIGQEPENGDASDEGGHGLDDEKPLPTLQAEMTVEG